jgi:protein-S-isoprenylcysteine O-methyltransferase Ste14
MRIKLTWVAALTLAPLLIFTNSAWDQIGATLVAETLFVLAIALVGISAIGRLWCSLYIAGKKHENLVVEGPYSLCRNPLYLFSFLGAVGLGLGSETCTIPIIVAIGFASYYPFVIRREEEALRKLHGEAFQSYLQSTPRFFPSFQHFLEPSVYSVNPITFRKHCLSAVWFVLLLGLLEIIEALHEVNVLPAYYSLY